MAQFALTGLIKITGSRASVKAIRAVDRSVASLQSKASALSHGFSNINRGLLALGAAGAAVGTGFGLAISKAGKFQQQIARVAALTGEAKKNFASLEDAALKAGSKTQFTSIAAGKALEYLTLAGFKAADSIKVLPVILDTATAGALDLGRASDIVTDSMSALTLAFSKNETTVQRATRLADIFSKVQAKANTNIEQLGEAVKFGGGSLAAMEIPLEQIIAAMGKLADAGLKGSMGGTNLAQAFEKLIKPTRITTAKMKALGVNMRNLPIQDLPKLVKTLGDALHKIKDPTERAALATELFGIRGKRAFNALLAAGEDSLSKLSQELKKSAGFSKEIADVQRRTFEGQRKSLMSAIEGAMIGLGNLFIKNNAIFSETLGSLVKGLQDVATAFRMAGLSADKLMEAMAKMEPHQKKILDFVMGFKEGILEAFITTKEIFLFIKNSLLTLFPSLEKNLGNIGRLVGKLAFFSALIAPFALGFVALTFAVGALLTGLGGLFTVFKAFLGIGVSLLRIFFALNVYVIALALKILPLLKAAFIKLGAIFLANPIGLITLAVVAAIAAGILLYKNWSFLTERIKNLWMNLINFFKGVNLREILFKALLDPIKLILSPLIELIRVLSNSSFGKNLFGGSGFIKSFTDKMSLFSDPTGEDVGSRARTISPNTESRHIQLVPQQDSPLSQKLMKSAIENQRLSSPAVSDKPASINVTQAPIDATFHITVEMDGEVIDRKIVKRSIENSERLGESLSPKTRQRAMNGSFIVDVG